ncbi:MAG TPA: holo-ACP synthase [Rhizobacter sp.]|nr:holo-ACP synthase [Rhizobacter sp.]
MPLIASAPQSAPLSSDRLRVGLDLVQISRISESLDRFGERFMQRLFTQGEIAYSLQDADQSAERLAARFAAKEAAIKAFSLSDAGVNWRDIEVCKLPDGACRLALHGKAAERASQLGVAEIALSLSHDGDYAGAVVTALCDPSTPTDPLSS